jgi:Fe2+ transport system protein B
MGDLVGRGCQAAMGFGLRAMGQAVLLVVMVFSIFMAVLRSAKLRCDGSVEAVLGMFQFAVDHLGKMTTAPVIGTQLHGGILGGVAAERANRRWK